jgi:hypothetical protein
MEIVSGSVIRIREKGPFSKEGIEFSQQEKYFDPQRERHGFYVTAFVP